MPPALVFDVGGVEASPEVAIEIHSVGGQAMAVQFSGDDVQGNVLGVLPVVIHVTARLGATATTPAQMSGCERAMSQAASAPIECPLRKTRSESIAT